jgi:hypothetical protein
MATVGAGADNIRGRLSFLIPVGFYMQKHITKTCLICGRSLDYYTNPDGGRPKTYHPECRKYNSLLSWLEDLTGSIDFTDDRRRQMRGELWRIANRLNKLKEVK